MGDLSVRFGFLDRLGGGKTRGAEAPLLIVRDESHRLSLGGLVSTSTRLPFTGSVQHEMVLLIEEFSANG